jgi:tetratricopeptide (TPR) repeat protein
MNFLEKIAGWMGRPSQTPPPRPGMSALRDALEQSRTHKRAERYTEALAALEQADQMAGEFADKTTSVVVRLQRADILTRQQRHDEAELLLREIHTEAAQMHEPIPQAYALIGLGVIVMERGDPEAARNYFEQARRTAGEARAAGVEGRAMGYLADIYLNEGNASYALYLLREALPKLNSSGDIELSSYFVGRLGEAMIATGQTQDGFSMIGRALRLAEQLEFRVYERRWRMALAVEAIANSNFPAAKRHLMEVLGENDQPTTPDYVLLLCRLSRACLRLGEIDDALAYAQRALDTAQDSLADQPAAIIAEGVMGVTLRTAERGAEAIPHLQTAAAGYTDLPLTPAEYNHIDILRNLAAAQAETHEHQAAHATYQRAMDRAQAMNLPLELAGTQRDLGTLLAREGQVAEAIRLWMIALETYQTEGQHNRVARLYCDIAALRRQQGQGRRAMRDYENALTTLNLVDDDETRGIVLANAATSYIDQGDIDTAESFLVESIKIAQKLQDRRSEATRRGNFGWFLIVTGRAQRAIPTLEYALRLSEAANLTLNLAVQTDNLGLAHDDLFDYRTALQYHTRALELLEPLKQPRWEAVIRANIGYTLVSLTQEANAEPHLEAALSYARNHDQPEIAVRALNGQARIVMNRRQFDQAEALLNESFQMANRADQRRLIADTHALRSQNYAAAGDMGRAHSTWREASRLYVLLRVPNGDVTPRWLHTSGPAPSNSTEPGPVDNP